jgi:hypothetical protein
VVDIQTFHRALCAVEPAAGELVTHGDRQLAIAYDLNDATLLHDVGQLPKTPLEDGIRQTLELFRRLAKEGRLDTSDLDAPAAAPVAVKGDEP